MAKLKGAEDYPFYFGASAETLRLAGDLRHSMTPAEKLLWQRLRNRQVAGFRFRRQHPIDEFIVDFFCYEAMLVVEVDGEVHLDSTQSERDCERTRILNRLGIQVIRFANTEVETTIDQVVERIRKELYGRSI
ncbi:MAG: endonuclease domain-containing protein [bacterium]